MSVLLWHHMLVYHMNLAKCKGRFLLLDSVISILQAGRNGKDLSLVGKERIFPICDCFSSQTKRILNKSHPLCNSIDLLDT